MANNSGFDDLAVYFETRVNTDLAKKDLKTLEKEFEKTQAKINILESKKQSAIDRYKSKGVSNKRKSYSGVTRIKNQLAPLEEEKNLLEKEIELRNALANKAGRQSSFDSLVKGFTKALPTIKDVKNLEKMRSELEKVVIENAKLPEFLRIDTSSLEGFRGAVDSRQEEIELEHKLLKEAQQRAEAQKKYNDLYSDYIAMLKSEVMLSESDARTIKKGSHKAQITGSAMGLNIEGFKETESEANKIIEKYRQIGSEWNSLIGQSANKKDALKLQLEDLISELDSLEETFTNLRASGKEVTEDFKSEAHQLVLEITRVKKELKPTFFEKLLATFKRIGFYRLARDFFRITINVFKEGIKGFAAFDKSANETMSSLATSFEKLKGSVALTVMPLLETIAPIFQDIANAVASIANGINRASASAKGLTEYTRISSKYMKDFSEQTNSALLSFDKFETLNGSQDSMFEKADLDPNASLSDTEAIGASIFEIFNTIASIVKDLIELIKPMFPTMLNQLKSIMTVIAKVIKLVEPIIKVMINVISPLLDAIVSIIEILSPLLAGIANIIASIVEKLSGVFTIISGLLKLLKGDLSGFVSDIKKGFHDLIEGMINLVVDALNLLIKVILAPANGIIKLIGKIFGQDWNLDWIQIPRVSLPTFADGGIVEQGSLFVAGEAGAELVHSSDGTTGVTNVEQFKQAMVEALYECAELFGGEEGAVVLNIDGAEVARSRRFKAELNRTNSGLNLR